MNSSIKNLLFYSLVFLFFTGGTAVVLYAQGWRLDLATLRVKKIGALYIRSYPENARIMLNGKEVERPFRFFDSGTLVNELFPKRYELELTHDGYRPFRVHADVEPSFVTEFKYATLVPARGQETTSSSLGQGLALMASTTQTTDRGITETRFGNTARSLPLKNGSSLLRFGTANKETGASSTIPGRTVAMAWGNEDVLGILQENGDLYLSGPDHGAPAVRANDVKSFAFSEDGSHLAALGRHSLEIFELGGKRYWRFNIPDIEQAANVLWYRDERHLFIQYENRVAFLDFDDRALENLQTVSPSARSSYDKKENALYALEDGRVVRYAFPSE